MKEESIRIEVQGEPPKKDQGSSMWSSGKPDSRRRVELLRQAAEAEMVGRSPFTGQVKLDIEIFGEARSGDLDNLVGGILDALQSPPEGVDWPDRKPVLYMNDKQVSELVVRRRTGSLKYAITVSPCT